MSLQNVHQTYTCRKCGFVMDRFPWEKRRCRNCGSKNIVKDRRFY